MESLPGDSSLAEAEAGSPIGSDLTSTSASTWAPVTSVSSVSGTGHMFSCCRASFTFSNSVVSVAFSSWCNILNTLEKRSYSDIVVVVVVVVDIEQMIIM